MLKFQTIFNVILILTRVVLGGTQLSPQPNTDDIPNEIENSLAPKCLISNIVSEAGLCGQDVISTELPYINVSQHPGELCSRVCESNVRRICYFKFTLELYQAMGAACGDCARGIEADCYHPQCILGDGIEKGVMSIDRKIPGPDIQVCKDDLIIVDVVNLAHGSAAAIHWHGLHMQATPYMDGVPFVTQCPISYSNAFRYQFVATQAGTQFYHSHSGHHKMNGQYGALIVRELLAEAWNNNTYDYDLPEHYLLISDWMHSYAEKYFPGLPHGGTFPNSVLINGRGAYIDPKTGQRPAVPPTRYYVTPGKRYRFRLINSISHSCPFQLQIEQHNLIIISSDGYDFEPSSFDTLVSNAGERYDFVLDANHTGGGDFWIRVRGMGNCESRPIEAFALLRYVNNEANEGEEEEEEDDNASRPSDELPSYADIYPLGNVLNHPNTTCIARNGDHCVTELIAHDEDAELRDAVSDHTFFLAFINMPVPNEEIFQPDSYTHFENFRGNLTLVGAINNISLVFPDSPPLTQPFDIDETQFCDDLTWPEKCSGQRVCSCIHRLQVRLGSIVELIVVDESATTGRLHHPFHLHGYRFMVTRLGQHPQGRAMSVALARQMNRLRTLSLDTENVRPPFKDTVSIPSRGYAVIRFRADNPGFWLLHCHYEWHLAIGMGLLVQVGELSEMVEPPEAFPKCGNYLPEVKPSGF